PRFAESEPLRLEAGRRYRLRVDGPESYGEAQLQLLWATPVEALEAEAVRVEIDGFHGGDRTRIDLPAPQQRLMERIVGLGKPTVLVLMSGSAVAVNWAQEHVPAILEAWYPGQA